MDSDDADLQAFKSNLSQIPREREKIQQGCSAAAALMSNHARTLTHQNLNQMA